MNIQSWDLKTLYLGYDDPCYQNDLIVLDEAIKGFTVFSENLDLFNVEQKLVDGLKHMERVYLTARRLGAFISLNLSTNVTDNEGAKNSILLRKRMEKLTLPQTLFEKYIKDIGNLDAVIEKNDYLKNHKFFITEIKKNGVYLLSEEEEILCTKLYASGGGLLTKMHSNLTSTLDVEYDNKTVGLSSIRNLAYDVDPTVRKNAYFAELKSYKKIEKPIAFALNGIKNESITMCKARGYESVLDMTLNQSLLTKETLDAMFSAIDDHLVDFRKYLKRKAKLLGHKNGLPFYDLFAPMGKCDKTYTIEEAENFVSENFQTFSDDLANLAKRAFSEKWIDYTPRQGKRGGAFCASVYAIKESRILTNFGGSIGDVSTLAHELGHAYHNFNIFEESFLNNDYPMPIAETASILCETIVKTAAYKAAKTKEEKLGMLEQELQDATQVIVDILSRYMFESKVFELCDKEFLDENKLNELMIQCQKDAYGDGLDSEYLNPGMWINKGHYYNSRLCFYNFPYAFGLLFAKGIYKQYLEKGDAFVPNIKKLLASTGKMDIDTLAKTIGIDITDKAFWKSSLELIKNDIDEFLELTK